MQRHTTTPASKGRSASASGGLTSAQPAAQRRITSRAEFAKLLRRAGYSTTQAESILRGLPDPIDFDRDCEALFERGISPDQLTSAMGGSP
jgi:hypothetical protein